ncbi:MAG: hypothetical protein GQ570_10825 [Helicobacteraceae bacterium]|nr:hypothetical protein [Helicobacteraceae bacterium]
MKCHTYKESISKKRKKMKKLVLIIGLLFSVEVFASILNEGVEEQKKGNYKNAVKLYKQARDGGNVKGCFNLGLMYEYGKGVKQNKQRAAKLL